MLPGTAGKVLIDAAFLSAISSMIGYFLYSRNSKRKILHISNILFGLMGLFVVSASGFLLYIVITHQFNYYYVYNYTSLDLPFTYLISAFWGGQEGSFMLWILISSLVGLGLMRWIKEPYRGPVLFFFTLNQVFLLSMVAGIHFGFINLGASPFRTLSEAMPNAPFIKANPGYIPADGKGLNDMLKSPWMVFHPPALFLGFTLMAVPFCFSMAALWKRKYHEWILPAMPWTLGANLALFTAIFLGGYWAYVTLSFGGYWAWDPVENASFIPWLIGTAGIHTMIVQRKRNSTHKASLIFAILAYAAVVYETFLTRSGVLADASVHSFVDLGLYNQLVVFIVVILGAGVGMLLYRHKDLRSRAVNNGFLNRDFMTFAGAMILFLIGLIITLGTSSPIIGRLFTTNPTPPEISFYTNWTTPLVIIAALLTVIGQYIYWKRQDIESLSGDLLVPVTLSCIAALATVIFANIRDIYYTIYLLSAWFVLFGNGAMMIKLARRKPRLIGGTISHIGFGLLLLGFLASSVYEQNLLDARTRRYNEAVEQGKVKNDNGEPVTQPLSYLELKLNIPKVINGRYLVTYKGYTLNDQDRPGQQEYTVEFQKLNSKGDPGKPFYLHPQVYPMLRSSTPDDIQWSVDVDVHPGFLRDIYMYVAGSSYVKQKNDLAEKQKKEHDKSLIAKASVQANTAKQDTIPVQTIKLAKGDSVQVGNYRFIFWNYSPAKPSELPDSTIIAVHALIGVRYNGDTTPYKIRPLFAIYRYTDNGYSYSPPVALAQHNITVQFSNVDPESGKIELKVKGISSKPKDAWILLTGREKPFVSLVWLGTFVLLIGFSVSMYRHGHRT